MCPLLSRLPGQLLHCRPGGCLPHQRLRQGQRPAHVVADGVYNVMSELKAVGGLLADLELFPAGTALRDRLLSGKVSSAAAVMDDPWFQ